MARKSLKENLAKAKKNKNDEFFTQLTDIDKELKHYKHHFKGKIVFCNCDDPRVSNFFHYFSYNFMYFHNLQNDQKEQILNYKLMVYICSGTDSEKLEWFKTINIAGEELTAQELRNAVYSGSWVTDAKRYFSKTGCPAYGLGGDYLSGSAIRQDYLETAIKWINNGEIEEYMAKHQNEPNANELWLYFNGVINWVQAVFPNYRREMKGIEWGELYNQFKDKNFDSKKLEEEIKILMIDDDVTKKKGIYWYVLTSKEKYLNIRAFTPQMKRQAYENQNGICR